MNNSYDGKNFKRVGGGASDRLPASGVERPRAIYTATGGETFIDLASTSYPMSYVPGRGQLDVKRSSGGSLIVNQDYFETSPTKISFPASEPLEAGEKVEITKSMQFTGVMPAQVLQQGHTSTATVGQTLVNANFAWPYNLNLTSNPGFGAVLVFLHGVFQTRGVDYTEVNLSTASTNQIQFTDPLNGGENIVIVPTYQFFDATGQAETFNTSAITNLQNALAATQAALASTSANSASGFKPFVAAEASSTVPNTQVINRAKIRDLANNLKAAKGVERLRVLAPYPIASESTLAGKRVFGVKGDKANHVRLVGTWARNQFGTQSAYALSQVSGDYVEIVFYGTALNILTALGFANSLTVSIDGGTENAVTTPTSTSVYTYEDNTYPSFQAVTVASGLSLGLHTIRVSNYTTSGFAFMGYDIINDSATIRVNAGSAFYGANKYTKAAASTVAYKTGFANVLDANIGTKGGRAVIYLKPDGTVEKALQPTDLTQKNLSAADHGSEEVVRTYNFREFDGYNSGVAAAGAFTLFDGTTALVSSNANSEQVNQTDALFNVTNGDYTTFTFVGTGLDLRVVNTTNATQDATVQIDGVSVGTISTSSLGDTIKSIVSGLPYGAHTVTLTATSNPSIRVIDFIVYQPKTPSVPAGAVELSTYNLVADYAINGTSATGTAQLQVSKGVIRKMTIRDALLVGASGNATLQNASSMPSVSRAYQASAASNYVEHQFYGTGFELSVYNASNNGSCTVMIDGAPYTGSATTSVGTWTAGTSTLSSIGSSKLRVTGLTEGYHTVRFTNVSGTNNYACLDEISPIHSYADGSAAPHLSNSMRDSRVFTPVASSDRPSGQSNWSATVGTVTSSVTGVIHPVPQSGVGLISSGGDITVNISGVATNSVSSTAINFYLVLDGMISDAFPVTIPSTPSIANVSVTKTFSAGPGFHYAQVMWQHASGSLTLTNGQVTISEGPKNV